MNFLPAHQNRRSTGPFRPAWSGALSRRAPAVSRLNRGESVMVPRVVCPAQPAGGETLKIGIFGGIHGDEPAGVLACQKLISWARQRPTDFQGYELHVYPLCNPSGFRRRTRECFRGYDLNREFWQGSKVPEVRSLERELERERYDGIISLHSDDTSPGVYGFVGGAVLSEHVLKPGLEAAAAVLPRNDDLKIDGFEATGGIIREGYTGILSAPPGQRPHCLEIVFETPALAPLHDQVKATVCAVKTMLTEYRQFLAYAVNL